MTRNIQYSGKALSFNVKRSRRRRTIALRVEPSGAVTVYAPHYVWGPFLDRFVAKHAGWIFKKLTYFRDHPELASNSTAVIPDAIKSSYRLKTLQQLTDPVETYSQRMGVRPRSVKVANQNSRWGSCSVRGDLRFSWRLAALPAEVFEYVVIHELAHLQEHNHSPRFWAIVERFCPDFKSHRRWLRHDSRKISWS